MKLLLIDDDAFLRDMYALKFKDTGYEVEVADGAVTALRVLERSQDFDVIMLDMIMPGMTGTELIRAIREKFPDMKAKCIVLSNQGQDEDIEEATKAGADGYIIKAEAVPSDVVKKVEAMAKK
ncbi:MAG: response regulator [Candidatus Kaiserbacteria bacterium]|nr:response regulator [Candidatus Kaiserbacteria bacterium]MCB9816831.1 response regulator [Candidatus Nomurabacteria bacterium]